MLGITDLTTYVIGTVVVILLPGPNSMYCLTTAGQHGVKVAYRAVAGILLGDSLLILATVLGAGTLLKLYPALFHGIKLLGGLYLAYLGWNLLRGAVKKWCFVPFTMSEDKASTFSAPQHIFKRALLLSLANPKAILFLLSFFVQFVDPTYPQPMLSFLLLAAILQGVSFLYLSVLVWAGHGLTQAFKRHHKTSALAMGMVGVLFMGFAVQLWLAGLE